MITTDRENSGLAGSLILVRVGVVGRVGRFSPAEPTGLKRNDRVVCRTARGLEIGVVLSSTSVRPVADGVLLNRGMSDGRVLRRTTAEDELLWGHLQLLGEFAFASCKARLAELNASAVLVEVEPLLDGRTLYFHFLSEVDEQVQSQLDQLVEIYEQKVRESKFANLLNHGCGPGCGTAKAKNGCGARGGCAVCKVTAACGMSARGD